MFEAASPMPLYHRILVVLRQRIAAGAYDDDGSLPTEKQLEAEFGVSRITVRRAMDALQAEGMIRRRPGRGTFLVGRPQPEETVTTWPGPFENLVHMGLATDVAVIDFGYEPAGAIVARRLEIEPRDEVQRAVRVRAYKGLPFSYLTTWVPGGIGRTFDAEALRQGPLLLLLERAGARPSRAEQFLFATAAEPEVAQALDVPVAAPLLTIERVVRDAKGRPIELLEALYRPDRYRYLSTLSRNASPDGPVWLTDPGDRA